jgi:hypothetical protein
LGLALFPAVVVVEVSMAAEKPYKTHLGTVVLRLNWYWKLKWQGVNPSEPTANLLSLEPIDEH